MKKRELKIIIDKVRNRCGLEEPTKVTYDRNEDGQVVFRFYFDSLYLPPEMQFNEPKVLNTFVRKDLYEFKDEFQITKLDKKKGFVEVLPDDQHFKVVKSYKDAKEAQKDEESVHLHDGNRLNENFIRDLDLVLRESDGVSDAAKVVASNDDASIKSSDADIGSAKAKLSGNKEKKVERTREVDLHIFKWAMPNGKEIDPNTWTFVRSLIEKETNILLFGYPFDSNGNEQDDKYPSMMTDCLNLLNTKLALEDADTSSRFGLCGKGINISEKLADVKKVNNIFDYTDDQSAMQILKDANIKTDEIEDFPKETQPSNPNGDPTASVLADIRKNAEKIADEFSTKVRTKGKIFKVIKKETYDELLKQAKSVKDMALWRALQFCVDVYGKGAKFEQDKAVYKSIEKANILVTQKYKKISSDPKGGVINVEKEEKSIVNQVINNIYNNRGLTNELETNKQKNQDAANGGLIQRNVSIGRSNNKNKKDDKKDDPTKFKTYFPNDFYVFCMKNGIDKIAAHFAKDGYTELIFSDEDPSAEDQDKDKTEEKPEDENTPKKQGQAETGEKTGDATPQAQDNTPQEGSDNANQGA